MSGRVWAVLLVATSWGCSSSDDGGDAPDRGPDRSPVPVALEVAGICDLEIGLDDTDPAQQFSSVRGAYQLEDGRIVVVAGGARELRYFSPTAEHIGSAGGEGDGPGELRQVTSTVKFADDSVAVYDRRARRLTIFDGYGDLATTHDIREIPSQYGMELLGRIGDRFAYSWRTYVVPTASQQYYRDTVHVGLLDPATADVDTLATLPGQEWYFGPYEGPARPDGMPPSPGYHITFGYDAYVSLWRGQLAHGDGSSRSITVIDPVGGASRTISWGDQSLPSLDDPFVAEYVADRRDALGEQLFAAVVGQLEVLPDDHVIPAYSGILGRAEDLWVRNFPDLLVEPDLRPETWTVLDTSGAPRANVTTPPGFDLLDASDGFVLGLRRTDLEVPYVSRCAVDGWPGG